MFPKDFFLSQKCVLTHHTLLIVLVFFFTQQISSRTRPFFCDSLLFFYSKNVLFHHFMIIFFIPKVCPHLSGIYCSIVFFSQYMSSLTTPYFSSGLLFFSSENFLTHHFMKIFLSQKYVLTHQVSFVLCYSFFSQQISSPHLISLIAFCFFLQANSVFSVISSQFIHFSHFIHLIHFSHLSLLRQLGQTGHLSDLSDLGQLCLSGQLPYFLCLTPPLYLAPPSLFSQGLIRNYRRKFLKLIWIFDYLELFYMFSCQ